MPRLAPLAGYALLEGQDDANGAGRCRGAGLAMEVGVAQRAGATEHQVQRAEQAAGAAGVLADEGRGRIEPDAGAPNRPVVLDVEFAKEHGPQNVTMPRWNS